MVGTTTTRLSYLNDGNLSQLFKTLIGKAEFQEKLFICSSNKKLSAQTRPNAVETESIKVQQKLVNALGINKKLASYKAIMDNDRDYNSWNMIYKKNGKEKSDDYLTRIRLKITSIVDNTELVQYIEKNLPNFSIYLKGRAMSKLKQEIRAMDVRKNDTEEAEIESADEDEAESGPSDEEVEDVDGGAKEEDVDGGAEDIVEEKEIIPFTEFEKNLMKELGFKTEIIDQKKTTRTNWAMGAWSDIKKDVIRDMISDGTDLRTQIETLATQNSKSLWAKILKSPLAKPAVQASEMVTRSAETSSL